PAFGPTPSPQQARESSVTPSDSSAVITRSPSLRNAGDDRILGIQVLNHWFAARNPPGPPSAQRESCPSWQRSGVMEVRLRVVEDFFRSRGRSDSGLTRALQYAGRAVMDRKYTNGLCRLAYCSLADALVHRSRWPSRERWQGRAMSCM